MGRRQAWERRVKGCLDSILQRLIEGLLWEWKCVGQGPAEEKGYKDLRKWSVSLKRLEYMQLGVSVVLLLASAKATPLPPSLSLSMQDTICHPEEKTDNIS